MPDTVSGSGSVSVSDVFCVVVCFQSTPVFSALFAKPTCAGEQSLPKTPGMQSVCSPGTVGRPSTEVPVVTFPLPPLHAVAEFVTFMEVRSEAARRLYRARTRLSPQHAVAVRLDQRHLPHAWCRS